jgi:hypothetical protein
MQYMEYIIIVDQVFWYNNTRKETHFMGALDKFIFNYFEDLSWNHNTNTAAKSVRLLQEVRCGAVTCKRKSDVWLGAGTRTWE